MDEKADAAFGIRWADGIAVVEIPVEPLIDAAIVPMVEWVDVTNSTPIIHTRRFPR